MNQTKRYKKGHFINIGITMGLPIGIPLGLAVGNFAIGFAISLPIGIAIGALLEIKQNPNPILPSKEEIQRQKIWSLFGIGIGLVLLTILVALYFKLIP